MSGLGGFAVLSPSVAAALREVAMNQRPPATLFGLKLIPSHRLPVDMPDDGENARRIVRHGLKDVLEWLGEDVGPKPGEVTHAVIVANNNAFVSHELLEELEVRLPVHETWQQRWSDPDPDTRGIIDGFLRARSEFHYGMGAFPSAVRIVGL